MKYKLGNIKETPLKLPVKYDKLSPMARAEIRDRYIELQKGRCWHCRGLLNKGPPRKIEEYPMPEEMRFPKGFFKHKVHLHHNHETGLTVGATHAYCNAILFVYHGE